MITGGVAGGSNIGGGIGNLELPYWLQYVNPDGTFQDSPEGRAAEQFVAAGARSGVGAVNASSFLGPLASSQRITPGSSFGIPVYGSNNASSFAASGASLGLPTYGESDDSLSGSISQSLGDFLQTGGGATLPGRIGSVLGPVGGVPGLRNGGFSPGITLGGVQGNSGGAPTFQSDIPVPGGEGQGGGVSSSSNNNNSSIGGILSSVFGGSNGGNNSNGNNNMSFLDGVLDIVGAGDNTLANSISDLLNNVGNTAINIGASNYAADKFKDASAEELAFQRQMYGDSINRLQPYYNMGTNQIGNYVNAALNDPNYANTMQGQRGINTPDAIQTNVNQINPFDHNDQGLRFLQDEMQRSVESSAAARGKLGSGGTLAELQDRSAGIASARAGELANIGRMQDASQLASDGQYFGQQLAGSGLDLSANNQLYNQLFNNNQFAQANDMNNFNQLGSIVGAGQNAAVSQGGFNAGLANSGGSIMSNQGGMDYLNAANRAGNTGNLLSNILFG